MRLQSISVESAQKIWDARAVDIKPNMASVNIDYIGDGEDLLTDLELDDLVSKLKNIQKKYKGKNFKTIGGQIDAELPEIIHGELDTLSDIHALSNIGFWRWLSNVACDGFFWHFIMWRFDSDKVINWGITSPANSIEVYFYRAWLRGHKMADKSLPDPYKYARIGTSDVWRSHILRQDFGRDREFVKAFLDTLYDETGKTLVGTNELRQDLIPAIRAWTSSATFSHLTYKESLDLIKKLRTEEAGN